MPSLKLVGDKAEDNKTQSNSLQFGAGVTGSVAGAQYSLDNIPGIVVFCIK